MDEDECKNIRKCTIFSFFTWDTVGVSRGRRPHIVPESSWLGACEASKGVVSGSLNTAPYLP